MYVTFGQDAPPLDLTPEQTLTQLQAQIQALATSMQFAQRTGQLEALDQFRVQFRTLVQQAAALRGRINEAQAPSDFMLALDQFSTTATQLAKETATALPGAIRALPIALGLGVALGLVVLLRPARRVVA